MAKQEKEVKCLYRVFSHLYQVILQVSRALNKESNKNSLLQISLSGDGIKVTQSKQTDRHLLSPLILKKKISCNRKEQKKIFDRGQL